MLSRYFALLTLDTPCVRPRRIHGDMWKALKTMVVRCALGEARLRNRGLKLRIHNTAYDQRLKKQNLLGCVNFYHEILFEA